MKLHIADRYGYFPGWQQIDDVCAENIFTFFSSPISRRDEQDDFF